MKTQSWLAALLVESGARPWRDNVCICPDQLCTEQRHRTSRCPQAGLSSCSRPWSLHQCDDQPSCLCSSHIQLLAELPCSHESSWDSLQPLIRGEHKVTTLERPGSRLIELMLLVTHLVLQEKSEQRERRVGNQFLQLLRLGVARHSQSSV